MTDTAVTNVCKNNTGLIVAAVSGVIIFGLGAVIVYNYKDASVGKHVRTVTREAMLSRGARYRSGAYEGGPLKPGVRVTEPQVVAGIINSFMGAKMNNPDEKHVYIPMESDVYSEEEEEGQPKKPSSFADFSGNKNPRKFNPNKYLRAYEVSKEEGAADDDDDGGSGETSEDENTYVDIGARKIGKPPKFPEEPINTNVHGDGESYTTGEMPGKHRRSKKPQKQKRSTRQPRTPGKAEPALGVEYDFDAKPSAFTYTPEM